MCVFFFFFFSSRRRHTRSLRDWSSDVCSSDLETRLDRRADRRLMRYLRTIGDVGIGAQTVREQPTLILSPQEPGDERAPELYAFRVARGLSHHPRNIIYSLYGRVPPQHPMLTTPGLSTIILTTPAGRAELARRGIRDTAVIVEPLLESGGLARAHTRLRAEHGVRYIACEGGQTLFGALRAARLLDEVFLTTTDVVVDRAAHEGVLTTFDFAAEGATLVAEGRLEPAGVYTFKRWRFGGTRRWRSVPAARELQAELAQARARLAA